MIIGLPSERMRRKEEELDKAAVMKVDLEPPKKTFTKKCKNVETLESYSELELAVASFLA